MWGLSHKCLHLTPSRDITQMGDVHWVSLFLSVKPHSDAGISHKFQLPLQMQPKFLNLKRIENVLIPTRLN